MKSIFKYMLRGAGYLFDLSGSHSTHFASKYGIFGNEGLRSDAARLHSDAKRLNSDMRQSFDTMRRQGYRIKILTNPCFTKTVAPNNVTPAKAGVQS